MWRRDWETQTKQEYEAERFLLRLIPTLLALLLVMVFLLAVDACL
jgi:hypothetical protein